MGKLGLGSASVFRYTDICNLYMSIHFYFSHVLIVYNVILNKNYFINMHSHILHIHTWLGEKDISVQYTYSGYVFVCLVLNV